MKNYIKKVRGRAIFLLPLLQLIIALVTLWRLDSEPKTMVCKPNYYEGSLYCIEE